MSGTIHGSVNFTTSPTLPSIALDFQGTDVLFGVQAFNAPNASLDLIQAFGVAGLTRANRPSINASTNNPTATLQLPANVGAAPTAAQFNALLGVTRTLVDMLAALGVAIET